MNTDELIRDLQADLRPVRRLPSPWLRFVRWLLGAVLCLGAGLAYYGFRHDLGEAVMRPAYVVEAVVLVLLVTSSALAAFFLGVPGWEHSKLSWRLAFLPPALWAALALVRLFAGVAAGGEGGLAPGHGWGCIYDILAVGVLPAAMLFFMVRRAAPQKLGPIGGMVLLAGAALGALASHLGCANDAPMHVIVWHIVPVLGLGALGVWLGRRFIASRR